MFNTCPVCVWLALVLLYHLKLASGPAAGLQQARRKAAPSVMSLEGLPDTLTALEESGEDRELEKKVYIFYMIFISCAYYLFYFHYYFFLNFFQLMSFCKKACFPCYGLKNVYLTYIMW